MKTEKDIRISVIIPVYNGKRFLREAVQSVIGQTLPPIELILVDDGSDDDSLSIVKDLQYPFPVIYISQENAGQSSARNHGVRIAKGDYVAFLDHDDIWYPYHLQILAEQFLENPYLGFVYSNMDEIDEHGNLVNIGLLDMLPNKHPKTSLIDFLSEDLMITPTSSLIRREAFLEVGGFDERLSGYEDDDLFLRLFRRYKHKYINEPLYQWRIWGNSCSYSERMAQSRKIYAEKLINNFPNVPEMCRYYVRDCIAPRFLKYEMDFYDQAIIKGEWEKCKKHYKNMMCYWPFMNKGKKMTIKLFFMRYPRLYTFLKNFLPLKFIAALR